MSGQASSNGIITWQSSGGRWNILAGERADSPRLSIPAASHPFIRDPWYSSSLWSTAEEALAELHKRHPEVTGYTHESYALNSERSLALLTSSSFKLADLPDVFFVDVEHGTVDFRDPQIAALVTLREQVHMISWLTMDEADFDVESWMQLPEGLRSRLVSDAKPGGERLFKLITEVYLPLLEEDDGGFWGNDNYTVRLEKELGLDLSATANGPGSSSHDSLFTQTAYKVGKTLGNDDAAVAFFSHTAAMFIWVAVTPAMVYLGLRQEDFQDLIHSLLIERVGNSDPAAAAELTDAFAEYDSHSWKILTHLRVVSSLSF